MRKLIPEGVTQSQFNSIANCGLGPRCSAKLGQLDDANK